MVINSLANIKVGLLKSALKWSGQQLGQKESFL